MIKIGHEIVQAITLCGNHNTEKKTRNDTRPLSGMMIASHVFRALSWYFYCIKPLLSSFI